MKRFKILILLMVAVLPIVLAWSSTSERVEAGVNAVAIFYPNRTYNLRAWDDLEPLQIHRRHVTLSIYHVQSPTPGALPNNVMFSEHDMYCLKNLPEQNKLMMRAINIPPGPELASEFTFDASTFVQDFSGTLRNPAALATAGTTICTRTLNPSAPNYQTLANDANAHSLLLDTAAVPSSGTY